MKFSSIRRLFGKLWNRRPQPKPYRRSPYGASTLRLTMEALEDRTVMSSTLAPVALVSEQTALAGGLAPQMVVDPFDPSRLVAVATTGTSLVGLYTEDGGDTWNTFGISGRYTDPNIPVNDPNPLPYTAESDPSISFDLLGNFYISSIQHNGTYTSGSVALHKFRWDAIPGAAPVQIQQAPDIIDRLYQWVAEDAAYNTFVAVDTNLIEYTDPTTNAPVALDDTMTTNLTLPGDPVTLYPKAVYVAWSVNHTGSASRAMIAGSQDGGQSFTTMVRPSDGNSTDPQILFTQGSQDDDVPGGQLLYFYNSTGGNIFMDVTRPDGGNPTAPVASRASFFFVENQTIADAGPGGSNIPDLAVDTVVTRTITINQPNLSGTDAITDIDILLNLTHFDLRQLSVTLTPPAATGVGPITLFRNRIRGFNNADQTLNQGIVNGGQLLGIIRDQVPGVYNYYREAGTVFDEEAPRNLFNGTATNAGSYIAHYTPEYPTIFSPRLSDLYGLTAAQLSGDWTLTFTDHRDTTRPNPDPNPPDRLFSWQLLFSGLIDNDNWGNDQLVAAGTAGSGSNIYPNTPASAPTSGIGTMFSVVQDKTVGFDSPYQGRIYSAYTTGGGTDTNVNLVHIDQVFTFLPNVWSAPVRINNDVPTDNFSEGNRNQFMPTLAVDSATGTLVVTYYDARFDGANARVVTMITTSTDGGATFRDPVFLNIVKTAQDFLTGNTIQIEPVPGNQGAAGALGFGDRQALYAYQGRVIPLYSTNENTGGSSIYTAQLTIAAGPTVVAGDMGHVLQPSSVVDDRGNIHYYNHTYDADGVRQLTGFVVQFDRPIDISTFTVDDVEIHFRDPFTPADLPPTDILDAGQIIALDSHTDFGSREIGGPDDPGRFATRFLVLLDTPQSRIGTYAYAIGPMIRDNMRDPYGRIIPGVVASQEPLVAQQNLAIPFLGQVESSIMVTPGQNNVPAAAAERRLRDLTVEVTLTTANTSLITIELIAPDNTTIFLHGGGGPSGGAFGGTLFDDAAPTPIGQGNPPYTTRFRPDGRMFDIIESLTDAAGTWRLRVTSAGGNGTLVSWKLNMQLGTAEDYTAGQSTFVGGNYMDQNPDAVSGDGLRENPARRLQGDRFAVPDPVSGVPFQLPYTVASMPLLIPGAHMVQAADEVQVLTIVATGGTFTLDFGGQVTGNLAYDISTAGLRTALEALAGVGQVEVVRNNGTASNTYTITFRNDQGSRDVPDLIVDDANLTGPSPEATVTTIVRGTAGARVTGLNLVNGESLVVNGTASNFDVEFDRDIDVATFTAADILQIIGPYGPIAGVFTVTPVNPVSGFARIFTIGFPQQIQPGSYSIHLGSNILDRLGNGLDNNLNAGLDVLRGTDPTNANFGLGTYTTGTLNATILPNQTVLVPLVIPDSFIIQQNQANHIQFLFDLVHNNVPDLVIELIAPDGTVIMLADRVGSFGPNPRANFQNVTLDDFAQTPIQNGAPPFNAGPYKPQTPLSVLVSKLSLGTWQLRITNTGALTGTLASWQLRLPKVIPGTGLGEAIADRTAAGFRIFIGDPANVVSTTQWSPIGPQTNDDGFSGRVGAIAVDPSDPSGNTVYAAGANGGVWKTHNFLTTDPQGPTWVPLTDLGPTMAMNVGHIAVYGRNNDPTQSVVIVSTGDNGEAAWPGGPPVLQIANRYPGVGFLISYNGGASWIVLDSTANADVNGNFYAINSGLRDRTFVGSKVNKVIVDPTPLSTGQLVMYAAVSGNAAQQGVWRSLNSGRNWTRIRAGNATDVVLAAGSAGAGGQLTVLYAAFQGDGVYITTSALSASTMTLLAGNGGTPERRDFDNGGIVNPSQIPTTNPANTPNGAKGRILLVAPTLTNQPLQDTFYQGWLYALVIAANGSFDGLYLTKDFGRNWTDIHIPIFVSGRDGYPTNNETRPEKDLYNTDPRVEVFPSTGMGNIISSLTIDPNNPNVVYISGYLRHEYSNVAPDVGYLGYTEAFLRVDTTTLSDPYAVVAHDNSDPDGGTIQSASEGPTSVKAGLADYGILNNFDLADGIADEAPRGGYYNLMRDPDNPFLQVATQLYTNVDLFRNEGTDIRWSPFNHFWTGSVPPDTVFAGWFGHGKVVAVTDQVTGKTRLVVGSGDGVYTAVDDGTGGHLDTVGFSNFVNGSRTGNLQFSQLTAGAVQPSFVAADIADAVFYAMGVHLSITQTSDTILQDGGIGWDSILGGGEAIHVDPTGSGQTYQFRFPRGINQVPFTPTDFFIVTPPGNPPTSRIVGLLQAGDNPGSNFLGSGNGQWLNLDGYNFAVSPIDNKSIVISSRDGRIFRTTGPLTGGGIQWFVIGEPTDLDGSYAQALTFGAPSSYPSANPAEVIYAGTAAGGVFATFTGGGFNGSSNWKNLGAPDGSPIMTLIASPTANSRELYAVTRNGVYFMANTAAAAPVWTNITGNLFTLTRPMFNNGADQIVTLRPNSLTDLVADWRFAMPDNLANPTGPSHPVLYVSGYGGVFRSIDKGATWSYYPGAAQNASQLGGWLPNVEVRDLDLGIGNINPNSGFPDQSSGLNILSAYTYGRGAFYIRMDNSDVQQYLVVPNSGPRVASIAAISPNPGDTITGIQVVFTGPVDPVTFDLADVLFVTGPGGTPIAVASVTDVTPTPPPGQANLHNVYNILFQTPSVASGTYTIRLGTDIRDFSGNKLNQDNDNINGEIPADEFQGTINFLINQAPTIIGLPTSITIPPGSQTIPPISFTVADDFTPLANLVVTAVSNNQAVVLNANIVFGGSGANRTVTIAVQGPNPGTATLTFTITDHQGLFTQYLMTVNANTPPTIDPIPLVRFPHTQANQVVNPVGADVEAPPQTLTWTLESLAAYAPSNQALTLDQQYRFGPVAIADNTLGAGEKWMVSALNGLLYAILPSGQLKQYDGAPNLNSSLVIANLPALFHTDPSLLYWAHAAVDPNTVIGLSVLVNPVNGQTTIDPPNLFAGVFVVTIGLSDGVQKTTTSFHVHVFNSEPRFTAAIPDQTMSHETANRVVTANATDGESDPITFGATFSKYTVVYDLDQAYKFDRVLGADNSHGQNEKWLFSPVTGLPYAILPNGQLKQWNNQSLATSPVIANLPTFVHTDPTLLSDAVVPPDPNVGPTTVVVNVAGNQLTIDPPNPFVGIFRVTVQATDGIDTGTTSFLFNVTNNKPTLSAIADQTMSHTQANLQVPLTFSDADATDPKNFTVVLAKYTLLYDLDQYYRFRRDPALLTDGAHGQNEKWFVSDANGLFYAILPNGQLKQWNGSSLATSPVIGTLPTLVHTDPNLLAEAVVPPDPNVGPTTVAKNVVVNTPTTGTLTLDPPAQFTGIVQVTVNLSDGMATATRTFLFNVTNTPPTLTPIADRTMPHTQANLVVPLGGADGDGDTVTYQVTLAKYTLLYDLDQYYGFRRDPALLTDGAHGQNEKWFVSDVNGLFYAILPNGQLKQWNGSSLATSPVIGTLPTLVHTDPNLLAAAVVPPDPNVGATTVAKNVAGNQLTIDPPNLFAGLFQVIVQASDGITTSPARTFLVNVTNQVPTLAALADRSMSHTQPNIQVPLTAADGDADPLTFGVSFAKYTLLRDLDQQYQFIRNTALLTDGAHGQNEKWFVSQVTGLYYAVLPDGQLKQWNGSSLANSPVIATVTPLVNAEPTLLSDAVVPPDPNAPGNSVQGSVAGNVLTVDPPANFVGLITVTVSVGDGLAAVSRTFVLNVGNQAPQLAAIPNQTMAFNQDTLVVPLSATDADGDPITFSAQTAASSLPFALDQYYGFFQQYQDYRLNFYGFQEKWIRSAVNGNHYAILPNGEVYAITGDPVNPFGALIAVLPTAYYNDPSLLWNAQNPPIGFTINGNQLTLDPPANFLGTFTVTVTAMDPLGLFTQRTFTVTVN